MKAPSRLIFESSLVQVGLFRCPTEHPRFSDTGPTRHYCFVFPRTSVWIEHEGRRPFVADATVVPLYNAGHPYRRRAISDAGDRTDWFSVTAPLLRDMLNGRDPAAAHSEQRLFTSDYARSTTAAFVRQRGIVQHIRRGDTPDRLFVEESVIGVLGQVLDEMYPTDAASAGTRHRDLAEAARARLSLTFCRQEDLASLAAAIGCSVFHLCRVFRGYTGMTLHQYRNRLRLRKSLELLTDTDDDICSIALALGYAHHSHFTAAFSAGYATTPSRYRVESRR